MHSSASRAMDDLDARFEVVPRRKLLPALEPMNGINAPQRPDCMAGVRGLELRNVVANYPFERSRGFSGSEPNSGHGDHSRLSCSAGDTQLGARFCRDLQQAFCTDVGHHGGVAEKARIGRDRFRSEDDPPAAKPATPLLSLRWTFRAKRACVVITDAEPD